LEVINKKFIGMITTVKAQKEKDTPSRTA